MLLEGYNEYANLLNSFFLETFKRILLTLRKGKRTRVGSNPLNEQYCTFHLTFPPSELLLTQCFTNNRKYNAEEPRKEKLEVGEEEIHM